MGEIVALALTLAFDYVSKGQRLPNNFFSGINDEFSGINCTLEDKFHISARPCIIFYIYIKFVAFCTYIHIVSYYFVTDNVVYHTLR